MPHILRGEVDLNFRMGLTRVAMKTFDAHIAANIAGCYLTFVKCCIEIFSVVHLNSI